MMKLKRPKNRAEWEEGEYQEQVQQLVVKHRLTERR
jgi:hypothetical protein